MIRGLRRREVRHDGRMTAEESWLRAVDLLHASSDLWGSAEFASAFPDGVERVASAMVATIDVDDIDWIESSSDLASPKAEAAIFVGPLLVHAVLTGHGFGFEVRRIAVSSLRATSTPWTHPSQTPSPFRFSAMLDGLDLSFPWDPANEKQDDRLHEQFARLRALL
jgi:hypothetical protein